MTSISSKTISDVTTLLASSTLKVSKTEEQKLKSKTDAEQKTLSKDEDAENSLENLRTKKNELEKDLSEIQVNPGYFLALKSSAFNLFGEGC